jgi:hypothetical protein
LIRSLTVCCGWRLLVGCDVGSDNRNYFIFFSNFPGMMLGLFYTVSTLQVGTPKQRQRIEAILLTVLGQFVWLETRKNLPPALQLTLRHIFVC